MRLYPRIGGAKAALVMGVLLATGCGDSSVIAPVVDVPVAPVITELEVASVAVSAAIIVWSTDQPAVSLVEYGTTASYGMTLAAETTPDTSHAAVLTGLAPATTYHYRVVVSDASRSTSVSSIGTFTTEMGSIVDQQPPVITQVAVTATTTAAATVVWSTDEPALGLVEYGTTTSYGLVSAVETTPRAAHASTLGGLVPATAYHYRVTAEDSAGNVSVSGDGTFTTEAQPSTRGPGIWIGSADLAQLPMSGSAWNNLLAQANSSCGIVDLANQDQTTNVCIMAKALVFARTGDARYRTDVITALTQIVAAPVYIGRALALGRELGAYVIAADLIGLETFNPVLDTAFRTAIRIFRDAPTTEAGTLRECHERRPNNWGTHCGASRAAIAAYLGDTAELDRVAQVFRGWLGERSSYAGFSYGDLSWQCDASQPVGINPAGCTRNGYSIDGVIADDQRRAGGFIWPPPQENYVWEALQGALAQAVILSRAGYPVWDWGDRALLRAVTWLHDEDGYPAQGEDTWQPHIINHYYGTSFPAPIPTRAGKNVGWTDWTHG